MIHLSWEMTNAVFAVSVLTAAGGVYLFMRHQVNQTRERFFTKYGRYPGEPAPKHEPAE